MSRTNGQEEITRVVFSCQNDIGQNSASPFLHDDYRPDEVGHDISTSEIYYC